MLPTPILDVLIGLSLFYLLLSLICTTVSEMFANWLKTRATFLDQGITRLLGSDAIKQKLYAHPLIKSLKSADDQPPSYIPAEKFATALLDIVTGDKKLSDMEAVQDGTKGDADYQKALKALLDASPNFAALHKNVEEWFNSNMDRVSGWFKKNRQAWSLSLAILVTLIVNADTLKVVHVLWTNPDRRAAMTDLAAKRLKEPPPASVTYPDPDNATASTPDVSVPKSPEEALSNDEQQMLGELTGWKADSEKLQGQAGGAWWSALWGIVCTHLLGWILTMIAVSLGAPFWFDTLNRFMNIRNSGRAPDEPRDKSTKPPVQLTVPQANG
ncbi:MAG TPA: hypothetical protein VEU96_11575 [Bryobacteraceae bacterium]|nr:hypothetical protein [Bryobacteraceae bacterium]